MTKRAPRSFDVDPTQNEAETKTPSSTAKQKPRVRKPKAAPATKAKVETSAEDFFAKEAAAALQEEAVVAIQPTARQSRFTFFRLIRWAAGLLISVAVGLWLESLWQQALERSDIFGWAVAGLIALFVTAVLGLAIREWLAIRRLARVSDMRERAETALADGNASALKQATVQLARHYANDPNTAAGREELARLKGSVLDPEDAYGLHEKALLTGIDREAVATVSAAAKRVSVVTAVSPRALVDIGYVLFETFRLIRVIAELYGGRAGALGTLTLARKVVSHLAITGTISIGEGLVQQVLGQGLAAKLSTRLGEGVINGVMTARIGVAAIEVCRPAPFYKLKKPTISDFLPRLLPAREKAED
ncbi:MAG: TIGR01620 family protein [Pseudomonadota bacterium]